MNFYEKKEKGTEHRGYLVVCLSPVIEAVGVTSVAYTVGGSRLTTTGIFISHSSEDSLSSATAEEIAFNRPLIYS